MALKNPASFSRRLSGLETYALVIDAVYRYNIAAFAEGSGSITREEFQAAVNRAAAANPGARVRLKGILGFTRWVDSGIAPQVREISAPAWDSQSERGTEFMEEGFHPLRGGPICDAFLIPAGPTCRSIRIIVRVLHAAMDARGLQHFVKDIFRVLRGETPIGSNSTLLDSDITARFKNQVKDVPPPAVCIPVVPPGNLIPENLRYIWRRVLIPKNIGSMLPKMAIFLARHARKTSGDSGEVGFTIPVDLRGLRADVTTTSNMTGYMRIYVKPEDTPKSIMQQINTHIRNHVDCAMPDMLRKLPWIPLFIMIRQLRKGIGKALYETNQSFPTGGIVSMGMFKPEDYSCPNFRADTCIGIPGSVGKLNVVIMNHTDHTEVVFSMPETFNSEGQFDRMIEEFRQAMI